MKINIKVLFVIILIILHLIVGGFFIYPFFAINIPSIYVEIEITELTSEEIQLDTLVDISNPNPFDLFLKNIKIVSKTKEGDEFTRISYKGGDVPSGIKKSFMSKDSIRFQGDIPKVLINTITVDIGVKIFGLIEKEIPLKAVVVLTIEDFINNISIPKIKIHARIDEITEEGVIFNADINITNPSKIELSVDDIFLEIKTNDDMSVGSVSLDGGTLEPKGTLNLEVSGILMYEVLNASSIIIDLEGQATVNVAGISQSLSLSTLTVIDVPDLVELLELDNESFDLSVFGEFKVRLRGIIITVDFEIYNPSSIPLEARDVKLIIFGITGDKKKMIAEEEMETCIVAPKNEVCISTILRIPYLKLIFSGPIFLPKWIGVSLEGHFAINGANQIIPLSINGYLDPHIFR